MFFTVVGLETHTLLCVHKPILALFPRLSSTASNSQLLHLYSLFFCLFCSILHVPCTVGPTVRFSCVHNKEYTYLLRKGRTFRSSSWHLLWFLSSLSPFTLYSANPVLSGVWRILYPCSVHV